MTLGAAGCKHIVLNLLISLPFAMTYFLMADDLDWGNPGTERERKADEGQ